MKIILYTDLMQSLLYEYAIRYTDFQEGESEDEYCQRINDSDGFRKAIDFIKESFGKGEPDVDWMRNYMVNP